MLERPMSLPVNPPYVICYTPGKVGSTSVMRTLGTIGVPVHRCEFSNIKQYHVADYPTITLVRDPIAWLVSGTFEWRLNNNHPLPVPKDAPGFVEWAMNFNERLKFYMTWFDAHYSPITGVNVAANWFPKKTGWKIYSIRSLVVRTEWFDSVFADAVRDFLPMYYPDISFSSFKVLNLAKGTDRFEGYNEFIAALRFPKEWIQRFYVHHPFCKRYFLGKERMEWVRKWSKR